MKSIEDKGCIDFGSDSQEHSANGSSSSTSFDFHKGSSKNRSFSRQTGLGKPTPSKWDDAQKWLVNLSRGEKKQSNSNPNSNSQTKPRDSNADDRRLIAQVPKTEEEWDGEEEGEDVDVSSSYKMESKKVDCDESVWRINKPSKGVSDSVVRSICVRDMGTEMTPAASQEASRTTTPLKARTPATRSPLSSGCSTPMRYQNGLIGNENGQIGSVSVENRVESHSHGIDVQQNMNSNQSLRKQSPMEIRATAWDEAERAKYMARYKREEVKIQAWENHEKRKAEMEMRRTEVKAERLKSRAQEKYNNKVAATRRKAEEKRGNAEAKLNEKAVETSERADYIRRTGHLPSSFSFSFKLPSFCG